ncbi:MAG: ABC transporter ATP-binding protein [Pyrinomonadaceae bacterium]|nr:ABC transporter ATP-binding protein [Pyrinomonadaceae bacterium]
MLSNFAIKVENLSKCYHIYDQPRDRLMQMLTRGRKQYYREFWALKDVSFEVKKGETFGIVGRNGSGKSTLLQMICGTLNPTDGTIQTNGRVAALLELGSGFNPEFTGRENVYLNASVLGLSNKEIDERFDKIAEFADIGDFIEQPIKTYSSGMVVRLAFAVIAHVDADILVIDEALAVGDAFFTQKCMRFLREFMKKGTILFVSHDTGAVVNLCNQAILLNQGEVGEKGSPKTVCEYYLETLYESAHSKKSIPQIVQQKEIIEPLELEDQRLKFINQSKLRNDLQIFEFNLNAQSFGEGGASIQTVHLLDETEKPLAWAVGGEKVILRIVSKVHKKLDSPILGFFVKDRLGQTLFGDNTYLTYREKQIECQKDEKIQADFKFYMPVLPIGDYSITVAIANGTQEVHKHHHWIHDAIVFKSVASSVISGLVGIPMLNIKLEVAK